MILTNVGIIFFDYGGLADFLPSLWSSVRWARRAHQSTLVTLSVVFMCSLSFLLWQLVDALVPQESTFLRRERRRQGMQRHHLLYHLGLRREDLAMQQVKVSHVNISRKNFSDVPTAEGRGFYSRKESEFTWLFRQILMQR
eukprot:TRINITY_DN86362_c0_g1_i1.p1 TRINITY_DN86362_c0_g1~~TRINITY_DN86362_c0_g1_i1.p1  ORF type:complete len:141 (+),score=20.40 TRINITY_DN86362_c0_g1_i1:1-423(+)